MVTVTTDQGRERKFPGADRWRIDTGGILEVLAEGKPIAIFPPDRWIFAETDSVKASS